VVKGRQASDAILFPATLTTDFRKAGYDVGVEEDEESVLVAVAGILGELTVALALN
jgi:hypothetical protein